MSAQIDKSTSISRLREITDILQKTSHNQSILSASSLDATTAMADESRLTHFHLDGTSTVEKPDDSNMPIKATCHCAAISVTVPDNPKYINECQCTICRRYAAAWVYYQTTEVIIRKEQESTTKKYVCGNNEIEFHWCELCGCVMYWWPVKLPEGGSMMGINSRMMDPEVLVNVTRKVDYDALFM